MKKLLIVAIGLFVGMLIVSPAVFAQTVTSGSEAFIISAEVPVAGAASFSVNKVTEGAGEAGADLWEEVLDNNLNFGELGLDEENNIFTPESYYVIDVGSDGVGSADLSFVYENLSSPATATAELGDRGTLSHVTMVYSDPDNPINAGGGSLDQANSLSLDGDALASGQWYRLTVGIATGDEALEEGDAEPFTAQDAAGPYSGRLTVNWVFDI